MNDEITKRELLELTGISYGQLYRWKRERLLPDEWFRKRSTHTGQETFLPRDEAIARIQAIVRMKDDFTHEEIQAFFNPVMRAKQYARTDLDGLFTPDALDALVRATDRDVFAYGELLFALLCEDCAAHGIPPERLIPCFPEWTPQLGQEGVRAVVLECSGVSTAILLKGELLAEPSAAIAYEQTAAQLIERLRARIAPILN